MPRYHFHLRSDDDSPHASVAVDLATPADMVKEAGRIVADVARDELLVRDRISVFLEVQDEAGRPVFVTSFSCIAEWLDGVVVDHRTGKGPPFG
jgi:hypothetical protein